MISQPHSPFSDSASQTEQQIPVGDNLIVKPFSIVSGLADSVTPSLTPSPGEILSQEHEEVVNCEARSDTVIHSPSVGKLSSD